MIVHVHPDGEVTLDDPDAFTAFSVAAPGRGAAAAAAAIGGASQARDAEHVWVDLARLRGLGDAHGGPDWREGCDGMIAYARSKGWTDDEAGLVRAHLEPDRGAAR